MATLQMLQGSDAGRSYPLQGETMVLGRQNDSAICLAGKNVSRHHAQILRRGADYLIEDLASSNGTYLNGRRLPPYAPQPLSDDDQLQIGGYVFGLRSGGSTSIRRIDEEPQLVVRETVSATD